MNASDNQPETATLQPMPQVIADLIAEQGDRSDAKFCREYNFSYDNSTWSRVRRWVQADPTKLEYGTPFYKGTMPDVLTACEAMLRRIRERKVLNAKTRRGTSFIEFPHFKTIFDAAKLLLESDTQNRALLYLAPTGGGKTSLGREMIAREGGVFIEARESWRDSYYAAISDLCRAIGTPCAFRNTRGAEAELQTALNVRKMVLVFDEGEYFGPRSLNLIKFLLNQTPSVVLILAIPQLWSRVRDRAWIESMQIVRRFDVIERLSLIHPGDVNKFLIARSVNLNGAREAACKTIAKAANDFGKYDMVCRIVNRLGDQPPKDFSDVESTVINVQTMIGVAGATFAS